MTFEQIAFTLNVSSWIALGAYTLPGFYRVFRGRASALDPVKATLFFVALSQFYLITVRSFYQSTLWNVVKVPWWTFASIVTVFALGTVIVILYKTENALKSLKP
jgi:hypothetical protein